MELTEDEFALEMAAASVATQSECDHSTMALYWDKFQYWPIEDFRIAIRFASDHTNKFPTVWQIKDARPKHFAQATDVIRKNLPRGSGIEGTALIAVDEQISKQDQGIEEQIDSLTDEEFIELVVPLWSRSKVTIGEQEMDAAKFTLKMFRRNPNSAIYRGFVRDAITKGRSWLTSI